MFTQKENKYTHTHIYSFSCNHMWSWANVTEFCPLRSEVISESCDVSNVFSREEMRRVWNRYKDGRIMHDSTILGLFKSLDTWWEVAIGGGCLHGVYSGCPAFHQEQGQCMPEGSWSLNAVLHLSSKHTFCAALILPGGNQWCLSEGAWGKARKTFLKFSSNQFCYSCLWNLSYLGSNNSIPTHILIQKRLWNPPRCFKFLDAAGVPGIHVYFPSCF